MLNLGPSSVVLPVYFTSIMRRSPLAKHGSASVPTPLEPFGQSSRSLGGAGGVLGAGGATAAGGAALGATAGGSFFFASSSQPKTSEANPRLNSKPVLMACGIRARR